ncbi:serine/threonine/tyrosine-protein kinase HT1-like [Prosopis cineraria]|uniref:serine/threonine/tyrosine-protein kinase HT1-like n=1 Tax=Prosopis cineraria TaxID=364024 RepID=UPI00240F4704|nr:serine/threonine/tyrosine-protein kinase HT1-like [Prosopis cineraria]
MRNFCWSKQVPLNPKLGRKLSLGEYNGAVSWSKYLVSSGAAIKEDGEEDWSADLSRLLIGAKFAIGSHSRIYKGVYKNTEVAIKMISLPEEDEHLASLLERQFNAEVATLFRLHHPNIIKLVAACKKSPVFCIITEYMPGGSLRRYLRNQKAYSLPPKLVLKLALDIARGMQYLHSQGILHRDLKSENLLLGGDMRVKVADFGLSCQESESCTASEFTGTYRWMAPEMLKDKNHTKKADVYSFGIVLWELLTSLTPYENMTPEQAAFAASQKNVRPPLPPECPLAFSCLVTRCWAANHHKRPHFDEIVSILEGYSESLKEDPEFFSHFIPPAPNASVFKECLPGCISGRKSGLCHA